MDSQVKVSHFMNEAQQSAEDGVGKQQMDGVARDWCFLSAAGLISLTANY